jgi:hypothetical protein
VKWRFKPEVFFIQSRNRAGHFYTIRGYQNTEIERPVNTKPTNGSERLKSFLVAFRRGLDIFFYFLTAMQVLGTRKGEADFCGKRCLMSLCPLCPCDAGRFDKSVREAATDVRLTQREGIHFVSCARTFSSRSSAVRVGGADLISETSCCRT